MPANLAHKQLTILHGQDARGRTCGECGGLVRIHYNGRNYLKCPLGPHSHGAATDWKTSWRACGRIMERQQCPQ
jgi:hypothetical protein